MDPAELAIASELLARYAQLIDSGDFAAVGDLLAHATLTDGHGNVIATGAREVEQLYRSTTRRHDDGTPRTAHVITNILVERDPDAADTLIVQSRFTVHQATEDFPLQPVVVGRYVDRMARRNDTWVFVERRMIPELWGDTTQHLCF